MILWIRLKWLQYKERAMLKYEIELLVKTQHLQNTLWIIDQMRKEGRL